MIARCPLCVSSDAFDFDSRPRVPILLNRTFATKEEAVASPAGCLDMKVCCLCGFVWNAAFDTSAIVYDGNYENDQSHSGEFRSHLESMADKAIALGPSGDALRLLEIGAGQGSFLRVVSERAGSKLDCAWGFDTAWRAGGAMPGPRIAMHSAYLDSGAAKRLKILPNVAISRHTLEHVSDPIGFLRGVHSALPYGVPLAIETPCMRWILEQQAFQDFFYEHCSLFTAECLAWALSQAGFESIKVDHVFGGQYLWAEARTGRASPQPLPVQEWQAFQRWSEGKQALISVWERRLKEVKGPVFVWGAGAKGVTFAGLCDPEAKFIRALVDVNPAKQGRFTSLFAHAIIAPQEIRGPDPTIIIMNPNYETEIRAKCAALKLTPSFLIFQQQQ